MSLFRELNAASREFPSYQVEYVKAVDLTGKGPFPVTFIGVNNNSKYGDGRQAYVDILTDDEKHLRVNVSHAYVDDFDELIHDDEAMKEVAAGAVSVKFTKVHSKKYNADYARLEWID